MGDITRTDRGWSIRPSLRSEDAAPATPDGRLERGRLVRVSFDMILPNAATRQEVEEWVGFQLGRGSIDVDNPLGHHDFEVASAPLLEDLRASTDLLDLREAALERSREQIIARRNR